MASQRSGPTACPVCATIVALGVEIMPGSLHCARGAYDERIASVPDWFLFKLAVNPHPLKAKGAAPGDVLILVGEDYVEILRRSLSDRL